MLEEYTSPEAPGKQSQSKLVLSAVEWANLKVPRPHCGNGGQKERSAGKE